MNGTKRSKYQDLQIKCFGLIFLLVTLLALLGCTQKPPPSFVDSKQTGPPKQENTGFTCPEGDIPKAGSNNHRVTLSWNPSASSSTSTKVLYCLYRTQDGPVQKLDGQALISRPPCKKCERVNETAVPETHFTDLQVKNGAHYCYVALAMEIGDAFFSGFSNQEEADIPLDPAPVSSSTSSGKLCVVETAHRKLTKKGHH